MEALSIYLADGILGLGIDPDSPISSLHMYSDDTVLAIETAPNPIPVPTTIILLSTGLLALAISKAGVKRKNKADFSLMTTQD